MASPGQTSNAAPAPAASPLTPRRRAARISIPYALLAAAWIVGSDLLVLSGPGADAAHVFESIAKGLGFVAVTAALLQLFIERSIARAFRERKGAARALAESEARFRTMVEQSISGTCIIGEDGRFVYLNPRLAAILGYEDGAALVGRPVLDLVAPENRALVAENLRRRMAGDARAARYHFDVVRRDGTRLTLGAHGTVGSYLGRRVVIATVQDVTELLRAEQEKQHALDELRTSSEKLHTVNRALRTLSAGNETLVRASDEPTLLRDMCDVIVRAGGYQLALVSYVRPGEGRPVVPQASAGIALEDLLKLPLPQTEPRDPGAPTAIAARSGKAELHLDLAGDPRYAPWRDFARRHGISSAISLPLRESGAEHPYGTLLIAAADPDAFDPEAVRLLAEMANDLAFGIGTLRLREDQRASAAALRKSLEDTILAIAATTEMRDPYTAGHERRVAALAAAIARELGLAASAIEGIRFGAMIHDLGKIKIPAEILVKPTRLTPIEYELIKQHAQAGFDILKSIDFPWPVAQMVLQHHERLDGSGYPQGLKGNALIREARILAVADVVEAMSSHRPYRPGLGIAKALDEIGRGRGTLYDAPAVDACLRLFRDRGYELPA